MIHGLHQTRPAGAILDDECSECVGRSMLGLDGLLALDRRNIARLHDTMLQDLGKSSGPGYLTSADARLGRALYLVMVLLERMPDLGRPG